MLAFNAPVSAEKTGLILDALGLSASGDILAQSHRFCADLGIEMRLGALGVPESDFARMASEAHAIRRLLDNNPRDVSQDEILAMYRAAA